MVKSSGKIHTPFRLNHKQQKNFERPTSTPRHREFIIPIYSTHRHSLKLYKLELQILILFYFLPSSEDKITFSKK